MERCVVYIAYVHVHAYTRVLPRVRLEPTTFSTCIYICVWYSGVSCCLIHIYISVFSKLKGATEKSQESHDEKPVKSAFDPSGYDRELVEALERDIVQKKPNVKW